MRIRSTKPEFWRSERVAGVSWDARLVLKGLESFVDDNGVGKDDLALIVADVFPRDLSASPRDTLARVSEALTHLSEAGLLWRYEVNGTRYLYVAFWETIQRIDKPGKGRMPRPDGTMEYKESEIRESVARARESVAPGTGEQGNRGTGEQSAAGRLGHSTTEVTATEKLEKASLPPEDHNDFLQHLRDRGVDRPLGFVMKATIDTLEARIKEWQDDRDRAAKAPRVITPTIVKAPRDDTGRAVYEPETCPHDGEVGRCPMCRTNETSGARTGSGLAKVLAIARQEDDRV